MSEQVLTPERLAELRRIAEAATPGPWISPWHLECENAEEYGFYAANGEKVVGLFWFDGYHLECSEENARHIATFDPLTVLAMLDEIERLRRERDNWKRVAEQKTDALCDVAEERARLRTEREVLAEAVEARGRFAAHLLSCGACRPIDPCSTGKDLEDEWLVTQDEALAFLDGEKGGGEA